MREMRDVERREFSSANGDDRPATSKQKAFLKSLGGEVSDGLTKAEASRRIDELTNGRE